MRTLTDIETQNFIEWLEEQIGMTAETDHAPACYTCGDEPNGEVRIGSGPDDTIPCPACNPQDEADIPW